jgi:hypothetical protein
MQEVEGKPLSSLVASDGLHLDRWGNNMGLVNPILNNHSSVAADVLAANDAIAFWCKRPHTMTHLQPYSCAYPVGPLLQHAQQQLSLTSPPKTRMGLGYVPGV